MFEAAPVSTTPENPVLNCLALELLDRLLLIPAVQVAEVINHHEPSPRAGMPDWYLGEISWRELQVPLVCFETLSSGEPPSSYLEGTRIVVINAMSDIPDFHFFAIRLQGIPSPLKIEQSLQSAGEDLQPLELDSVYIGDELYKLPDLLAIEQKMEALGLI